MDLAHLKTFIAICESNSVSSAARRLGITQPAASKRILNLEKSLGSRLFYRSGHRLRLTESGHHLLPLAHKMLRLEDECRRQLHEKDVQVQGPLHIATSHHIGLYRLPEILQRYVADYPEVDPQFIFTESEQAFALAARGEVDLALVTLPEHLDSSIIAQPVWHDKMSLMVAPNHPLNNLGRAPKLTDLAQHAALLPDRDTFTWRKIEAVLFPQKLQHHTGSVTNNLETIRMLVSIGLGWSVLPLTMATEQLCLLKIEGLEFTRTLGAVFHPERTTTATTKTFLAGLPRPDAQSR